MPGLAAAAAVLVSGIMSTFDLAWMIATFVILGFITGFAFSGGFIIITDLAPNRRGTYTGIEESIVGVSFFVSSYVPFLLLGPSALSPFLLATFVMLGLTCFFVFLRALIPWKTPLTVGL